MEIVTKPHLLNTHLNDRVLWYDGVSSFDPAALLRMVKFHDIRFVTQPSPLVEEFNRHASVAQQIEVKDTCNPLTYDWTIPDSFKKLDVIEYLFKAHSVLFEGEPPAEIALRERRLAEELVIYNKYQLFDVIRTIIWIINTLTATNTVWGVGRGSSVSSYVLYIIGVHDVDSFKYDLDIDDFLHE
jgi:DNA polymerase III alpha subunit